MGIKFSNNAEGTLTAGVGSGDTTNMTLTAGDGLLFPTIVSGSGNYFYSTLVDVSGNREIVKVTEHQSGTDVFQVYVRAQDDTAAIAFSIGDKVQLRFPKIILEEFRDDIASNDVDIAALQAYNTASAVLAGPSGLTMFIYNPAGEIPTGWSLKSIDGDMLLAVADQNAGGGSYDVAGETEAGSWTPTGHVHTGPSHVHTMNTHVHSGPSHTHTTPAVALSIAQMPAHTHYGDVNLRDLDAAVTRSPYLNTGTGPALIMNLSTSSNNQYGSTSSVGSGSTHEHGATGASGTDNTGATDPGDTNASGTANTGTSNEPITDRPLAAVGLLIERD